MDELTKAIRYKNIAEPFLSKALGAEQVPWSGWTGPSVWEKMGKGKIPAYLLHLDVSKISASKLLGNKGLLYDVQTVLRSQVRPSWQNHYGLAILFDERPVETPNALDLMVGQCCFVVGNRRTGKTTLLQHLIHRFEGQVVILDPKPYEPGKWASKVRVVGQNGDYSAIAAELDNLMTEMHNRSRHDSPKLVIIDELYRIAQFLPDYPAIAMQILAFGGEGNMDVIVATQTDRLAANGLEGLGDLRAGFIQVRTYRKDDKFWVTVDDVKSEHPGRYQATSQRKRTSLAKPTFVENRHEPLTDIQRKMVEYAWYIKPHRSFALTNKMYGLCQKIDISKNKIQQQAKKWEKAGLLTPSQKGESGDVPRMVTDELLELAEIRRKKQ